MNSIGNINREDQVMKAEFNFPPELVESIATKVLEKILPYFQQQPQDEFLTIDEAAKLLKKSKEQLYQWVNNSKHGLSDFPFYKAGKSLMFSRHELVGWMRKNGKPSGKEHCENKL